MDKPMRMCRHPGCMVLTADGYCKDHKFKPLPRKSSPQRGASAAWHHLYTNSRYGWARRRSTQLAREPWCRECSRHGLRVEATEVDHIIPHRGNLDLFLHGELQSLCHACHSRKTVAENPELFSHPKGK